MIISLRFSRPRAPLLQSSAKRGLTDEEHLNLFLCGPNEITPTVGWGKDSPISVFILLCYLFHGESLWGHLEITQVTVGHTNLFLPRVCIPTSFRLCALTFFVFPRKPAPPSVAATARVTTTGKKVLAVLLRLSPSPHDRTRLHLEIGRTAFPPPPPPLAK